MGMRIATVRVSRIQYPYSYEQTSTGELAAVAASLVNACTCARQVLPMSSVRTRNPCTGSTLQLTLLWSSYARQHAGYFAWALSARKHLLHRLRYFFQAVS